MNDEAAMARAKELMRLGMEKLRTYVPPTECGRHPAGQHFHDCPDWDFLYICSSCPEFDSCTCYPLNIPVNIQTDEQDEKSHD